MYEIDTWMMPKIILPILWDHTCGFAWFKHKYVLIYILASQVSGLTSYIPVSHLFPFVSSSCKDLKLVLDRLSSTGTNLLYLFRAKVTLMVRNRFQRIISRILIVGAFEDSRTSGSLVRKYCILELHVVRKLSPEKKKKIKQGRRKKASIWLFDLKVCSSAAL